MFLMTSVLVALGTIILSQVASVHPLPPQAFNEKNNMRSSPWEIQVTQTAKDTSDRLTQKPSLFFQPVEEFNGGMDSPVVLTIDTQQRYQEMLGFGGAFTDAAAYMFSQMNDANQRAILHSYFGEKVDTEGANVVDGASGDAIDVQSIKYSVGRVHINSCDFSLYSYSFDDVDGDFNLTNFNISQNFQMLIPLIQQSLKAADREIKLFGSPWSPPAWMKSNNQMDGSNLPCFKEGPEYMDAWALYLSKFFTHHEEEAGIKFWGLTVQNEPEYDAPWEACTYTPEQERDFIINHLGPRLAQDHPDLAIMIYDHNKDDIVTWADAILSDPTANKYVSGVAFHWYSGFEFDNLETTHEMFPDKFLLASEATHMNGVLLGNWTRGEVYGLDILGDINSWASGWVDWNLILDMEGGPNHLKNYCDAPIVVDVEEQIVYIQPMFYYLGHLSRFVEPGSKRIGLSVSESDSVVAAAFITPSNEIVLVAMNQGDEDVGIALQDIDKGMGANYLLPEHSIVTFVYDNLY